MRKAAAFLLMIISCAANAQSITDTVHLLTQVEKTSLSVVRARTFHPVTPSKNMSDLLKEYTGVYLKSNGVGQLTSLSYRGTSAAQNDLLWNGIKLNSPSLGQVDVSLFCIGLVDEGRFAGNSEAGNVGGSLNVLTDNRVDSTMHLHAHITYGSFHTLSTFAKAKYGNKKVMGTTRISYLQTDNNYSFINNYQPGSPEQKQTNAKVNMLNLMQQFAARLNPYHTFYFNVWLSDAQRQIPPVMSKTVSKESQDDYSLRGTVTWKGEFRGVKVDFTSAMLHDVIHYRNPETYLNEKSIMQALRNNFSFTFDTLKRVSVKVDAGYDWERAVVPSYAQIRQRHIGKLAATLGYEPIKEILLQLKLREHVYDKILSPFSPLLIVQYKQTFDDDHTMQWTLNASLNFRFPTLNDLYWVPGGNQNLKTEKSWDGELQASYNYKHRFIFRSSVFCKYITDLILWQSTGSYWEPLNVKRVLTRGAEVSVQGGYNKLDVYSLGGMVVYTFTRATNLDAVTLYDQSRGKQLIYVPVHLLKAHLHLDWKRIYLRPVFTYTHEVFVTTDNSQRLKGYALLDVEVGKDFTIKYGYDIGFAFRVNNITGVAYQNVAQRPMPGRSFEGTLRFILKK